jgi:hypothetical protein
LLAVCARFAFGSKGGFREESEWRKAVTETERRKGKREERRGKRKREEKEK